MKRNVFAVLALSLLPAFASAAPLIVKGSGTGRTTRISLTPSSPRTIYVAIPSLKTDTQTLRFDIEAPSGAKISLHSSMAMPRTKRDLSKTAIFPTMMYNLAGQSNKVVSLGTASSGSSGGSTGGSSKYVCGCLTQENINAIIASMRQGGFTYTQEQVCAEFGFIPIQSCSNGSATIGDGSSTRETKASLSAFIQRDACSAKPHAAVLKVDLSKARDIAGSAITIKAKFESFDGNRRTKVKAKGEGRFPGTLLLAGPVGGISFTGSFGDPRATRWVGKRKVLEQDLDVADFVFYPPAGGILWRIPLPANLLSGARGTFELRSNEAGHSVCAFMAARDQFFNGYRN